jgi:hypothetical protein
MNATHLTYDQAVARAILRALASASPSKSLPHVKAAETRRANRRERDPILKAARNG